MAKKTSPLLPFTDTLLHQFGDRLRAARRRRRLTAKQVAERAGMSPMTLRSLERGGSGVTMGAYLAVMQVLGLEKDIDLLAKEDPLGRELQDAWPPAVRKLKAQLAPASLAGAPRLEFSSPAGAAAAELRRLIENSSQEQLRKAIESLPGEQLRRALEALPATQLQKALGALPSEQLHISLDELEDPASGIKKLYESGDWIKESGFASSETLAGLIDPPAPLPKKRH